MAGLPPAIASIVKSSVFAALGVAGETGRAQLRDSARAAFVAGIDDALRVPATLTVVAIVLALAILPARSVESTADAPTARLDRVAG